MSMLEYYKDPFFLGTCIAGGGRCHVDFDDCCRPDYCVEFVGLYGHCVNGGNGSGKKCQSSQCRNKMREMMNFHLETQKCSNKLCLQQRLLCKI